MNRHLPSSLALAVVTMLTIACGDETTSRDNIITGDFDMGTTTDMASSSDTGDEPDAGGGEDTGEMPDGGMMMDMENDLCAGVNCDVGQSCVEGMCVDRDICGSALDAGTLEPGQTTDIEGSFLLNGSDQSTASCGEADQLEQLVRFELTESLEVSWSANWGEQFDGLVALRQTCDDPASETLCSDLESGSAVLEAGEYFLYLEVRLGNPTDFELELSAEPAPTCTAGTATCDGNERVVCTDGTNLSRETCPTACQGGVCVGDSCADPIAVSASGGTYSGTGQALTSTLDFAANASCAQIAGMMTQTPGYDAVFLLTGLQAGTVVSIDAATNDGNQNYIFIQQTCGANEMCVDSYQTSQTPDFVVQTPGDYYVIIEKRQASNAPFEYSIAIQ